MSELKPSTLQDRGVNQPQVERRWTLRNESTKQPEYDLHRSVVTLCTFKIKEDLNHVTEQIIKYNVW